MFICMFLMSIVRRRLNVVAVTVEVLAHTHGALTACDWLVFSHPVPWSPPLIHTPSLRATTLLARRGNWWQVLRLRRR